MIVSALATLYGLSRVGAGAQPVSGLSLLREPWFLAVMVSGAVDKLTGLASGVAFERDWVIQVRRCSASGAVLSDPHAWSPSGVSQRPMVSAGSGQGIKHSTCTRTRTRTRHVIAFAHATSLMLHAMSLNAVCSPAAGRKKSTLGAGLGKCEASESGLVL